MILFQLIKWLKYNKKISPLILLIDGGDLENDFKELGIVWNLSASFTNANVIEKIIGKFNIKTQRNLYEKRVLKQIIKHKPQLIYVNSIVSLPILPMLKKKLSIPVLLHVHEMSFSVKAYYPECLTEELLKVPEKFIVVSKQVQNFLQKDLHIDNSLISNIPPFTNFLPTDFNNFKSSNKFVIGFCGFGNWRKGIHVLPHLIKQLSITIENFQELEFLWLGFIPEIERIELEYLLDKLGLQNKLIITGYQSDVEFYYKKMDIFVLLSLEDPFPLVCLEAGLCEIPILCFEKSGGAVDFVNKGGGISVPYLDIIEMAMIIKKLKSDFVLRKKIGKDGAVNASNHSIEIIAPQIWSQIETL